MSGIITLTTDFGPSSPYVAAMKGVILTIAPSATIVDLTHAIPPQNIRSGALVLAEVAGRFPPGTIHVVVIDPGVGTPRKIVLAQFGGQKFIGPDNGLFDLLARREPPGLLIEIAEPKYWLPEVAATFHGRDVMAPVAARLVTGLAPELLGPPLTSLTPLDWPKVRFAPGRIEGCVVFIDSFGNLITNVARQDIAKIPADAEPVLSIGGLSARGISRTYGEQPPGTVVALIGSSGLLELAVVNGNAARSGGARPDDAASLVW